MGAAEYLRRFPPEFKEAKSLGSGRGRAFSWALSMENTATDKGPYGLIAGNGAYPATMARAARAAGETRLVAVAFENETGPELAPLVDEMEWMRVGQLARMCKFFKARGVRRAVMVGQIAPKNLFDLRPDFRALAVLARTPKRNAESLFSGIADELAKDGVQLLSAVTYLEALMPGAGYQAGAPIKPRKLDDLTYGYAIAKEMSRLDIGQTVVVRNGTVLAVEAFEGTNEAIKRGGALGRKESVMVKVSKPGQDMRFDVPVIGRQTLKVAAEAGVNVIGFEAGKTLLLEKDQVEQDARELKISLLAIDGA